MKCRNIASGSADGRWESLRWWEYVRFAETYSGTYQIRGGARSYASARGFGGYVTKITGRLVRKKGRCTSAIAYFSQSTVTSGTSGSLRW